MIRLLAFFTPLLISWTATAQVWMDTNTWSPDWEKHYQEWVQSSWQIDVFSRKNLPDGRVNPYYGMRPDCADTVYSMRIIFSYENHLPFAVLDPTGSGRLITNRMTRFNQVANQDERFRRFLWSMYETISTTTLPNDTYPVAINAQTVLAGGLMMTTAKNHHSWSIKQILPIGVPWLVFNSRVSAASGLSLQERQSWPSIYWVFEGNQTPKGHAGFRAFRPLDRLTVPVWEVPGYSEEQYGISVDRWQKLAQQRLAVNQESDEQQLRRLLKTACNSMQTRVGAINDGLVYLASHPSSCMNYETYDNFSTPHRDQRLFDDLVALRSAYREILRANGGSNVAEELKRHLNKIYPKVRASGRDETAEMPVQSITADSVCTLSYAEGRTLDLAEGKRRLFLGLFSNNPHDGREYRWGELRGSSALARRCQSWDPWTPDLNTAN